MKDAGFQVALTHLEGWLQKVDGNQENRQDPDRIESLNNSVKWECEGANCFLEYVGRMHDEVDEIFGPVDKRLTTLGKERSKVLVSADTCIVNFVEIWEDLR